MDVSHSRIDASVCTHVPRTNGDPRSKHSGLTQRNLSAGNSVRWMQTRKIASLVLLLVTGVVTMAVPTVRRPFGAEEWEQSTVPIRADEPGRTPFWNTLCQSLHFRSCLRFPERRQIEARHRGCGPFHQTGPNRGRLPDAHQLSRRNAAGAFPPTYHGSRIGKNSKSHAQLDNYMIIVAGDLSVQEPAEPAEVHGSSGTFAFLSL